MTDVPVVLVGNKTDQWGDRMVSHEDGQRRSREIGCVCFHEISVRESIEQVKYFITSDGFLSNRI
jgi:GTPase SAR1 family protein